MENKRFLLFTGLLCLHFFGFAQRNIEGNVFGNELNAEKKPLQFATILVLPEENGVLTDSLGHFSIQITEKSKNIVVSNDGFFSDTIPISTKNYYEIQLKSDADIEEITVESESKSTTISSLETIKIENMGQKELAKAACCNLSESFETSASVDVSYADAVTGTKQIKMLGLDGKYTQILREAMPGIRGLSTYFGMQFVPGAWIESIQLSKGVSSVATTYESITGQINVELKKPTDPTKFYLNAYVNQSSRSEINLFKPIKLSESLSSAVLAHYSKRFVTFDRNADGFTDVPKTQQINFLNRWMLVRQKFRAQLEVHLVNDQKYGGQINYSPENNRLSDKIYGFQINNSQLEVRSKTGFLFPEKPYKSIGWQNSYKIFQANSVFGQREYSGQEQTFYSNLIYQTIIKSTVNQIRGGISLLYDDLEEEFDSLNLKRTEIVGGGFVEYTFKPNEKFSAIFGLRADYHNLFQWIFTPRVHLKWMLNENNNFRISLGKGTRTANVLSENIGFLVSSRNVRILENENASANGLLPESAWNFGVNFTKNFRLDYRDGMFTVDYYYTNFTNQVVRDLDATTQEIRFYNLKGISYSSSLQIQLEYELIKRLDLRLAYRFLDVKSTINGELRENPFVSKNRFFVNFAYQTRKNKKMGSWKFDATLQFFGKKSLPKTDSNPIEYQIQELSPSFHTINSQITKVFSKRFELYFGVDNILNFTQTNRIIAAKNPFSQYFDAAMVWGPVLGRMSHLGLRIKM